MASLHLVHFLFIEYVSNIPTKKWWFRRWFAFIFVPWGILPKWDYFRPFQHIHTLLNRNEKHSLTHHRVLFYIYHPYSRIGLSPGSLGIHWIPVHYGQILCFYVTNKFYFWMRPRCGWVGGYVKIVVSKNRHASFVTMRFIHAHPPHTILAQKQTTPLWSFVLLFLGLLQIRVGVMETMCVFEVGLNTRQATRPDKLSYHYLVFAG